MKFNNLLILFLSFLLCSCAEYNVKKTDKEQKKQYYSSKGFALIYDDNFYRNKVINKKPTKPLKKGEKIRLEFEVDESQNESYEIEGLGTIDENPFISFFASVGDFKYPKVAIKELSFNKWEIPEEPEQDKITLYLTLRDGTGGIRVYGPLDFDLE